MACLLARWRSARVVMGSMDTEMSKNRNQQRKWKNCNNLYSNVSLRNWIIFQLFDRGYLILIPSEETNPPFPVDGLIEMDCYFSDPPRSFRGPGSLSYFIF